MDQDSAPRFNFGSAAKLPDRDGKSDEARGLEQSDLERSEAQDRLERVAGQDGGTCLVMLELEFGGNERAGEGNHEER